MAKTHITSSLLNYLLVASSASLLLASLLGIYISIDSQKAELQIPKTIVRQKEIGLPSFLFIPAINVKAKIQYLGVNQKGEMATPSNHSDVGWFEIGTLPGNKGSAVIAGHLDGINGEEGVFSKLNKLKIGDVIHIQDIYGKVVSFEVRKKRTYNPGYADSVFGKADTPHLNLITCSGAWNETKEMYSSRLVVFTDILPLQTN